MNKDNYDNNMPKDAFKIKREKTETNITFTAIVTNKDAIFNEEGHIIDETLLLYFQSLKNGDQVHFEFIKR